MLTETENKKPLALLREIEAYLSFRLTADSPRIEETEIRDMKRDIVKCLRANDLISEL